MSVIIKTETRAERECGRNRSSGQLCERFVFSFPVMNTSTWLNHFPPSTMHHAPTLPQWRSDDSTVTSRPYRGFYLDLLPVFVFTPSDRSRGVRQPCDVSFYNLATGESYKPSINGTICTSVLSSACTEVLSSA